MSKFFSCIMFSQFHSLSSYRRFKFMSFPIDKGINPPSEFEDNTLWDRINQNQNHLIFRQSHSHKFIHSYKFVRFVRLPIDKGIDPESELKDKSLMEKGEKTIKLLFSSYWCLNFLKFLWLICHTCHRGLSTFLGMEELNRWVNSNSNTL